MKISSTVPTGQAQHFEVNELFFSTTDPTGRITAGNEVFSRTSGYTLNELLGRPHNLVRHRDMPAIVFEALWTQMAAGKPFMGYVKNQAKNGNHYWVFAFIIPLCDCLLSIRFKPTTSHLEGVERLYGDMRALENAGDSARSLFVDTIGRLGYGSYDAFSRQLLNTEILSRDELIAGQGLTLFPTELTQVMPSVRALYRRGQLAYGHLNALFQDLEHYARLEKAIQGKAQLVLGLTHEFRLNALNAQVASEPLGASGHTLAKVAEFMNTYSGDLSENVGELSRQITATTAAIAEVASNVAGARLVLEMTLFYLAEMAKNSTDEFVVPSSVRSLEEAFERTLEEAMKALEELGRAIPNLVARSDGIRKNIVSLQVAQIAGLAEASKLPEAEAIRTMFAGLRGQIQTSKTEIDAMGDVIETLGELAKSTPSQVILITADIAAMHEAIGTLGTVSSVSLETTEGASKESSDEEHECTLEPVAVQC